MKISRQLKGGIYEVSFGYNLKMEGCTTLMSDIPELSEIARSHYIEGNIYKGKRIELTKEMNRHGKKE